MQQDDARTALCRRIALDLVRRTSVTGTAEEAAFGPWLAEYLRGIPAFAGAEVSTFPVAEGDPRQIVAMRVPGASARTVVLTGHYDTVAVDDYGALAPLACDPEALAPALLAGTTGEDAQSRRVRDDLSSGRFLPGRGLLDMKAGLAAALAALATARELPGTVLFLAVPDEENASAGARAAAARLAGISQGLEIVAAINLDAIADDGDGRDGQVLALGTVGKTLPTALVIGRPVHSGFALRGLNAAVLAGAIAARLEWAPELADDSGGVPGPAASLLALRDGRAGYDVTTPAHAFAFWNVLHHRRDPADVLDVVEDLVRDAVGECLSQLAARAGRSGLAADAAELERAVPVLRYSELHAEVAARIPDLDARLRGIDAAGGDLPERCRRLTLALWELSGRAGPAVILGFGAIPYLSTTLAHPGIEARIDRFLSEAPSRHGCALRAVPYFAGISDMSFLGQSDAAALRRIAAETPVWDHAIRLAPGGLAQIPTVNLGPWGRDYHTPFERLETSYAFAVLPALLTELTHTLLAPDPPPGRTA